MAVRRAGQRQRTALSMPNPAGDGVIGTSLCMKESIVEDMVTIYAEELFNIRGY